MSSPGTDSKRSSDQSVEQTGDYAAHNTASDAPVGKADPLIALLRPPQADGELGRLAGFAVTHLLGQGGMGAVYAADDLLLHRKVALKVMRPELTARPEARERFMREAQTASGLEHDHVIPVHQIGEDNGVLFIAMPLLKGEPLDARLAREGRLLIPAVLKLGRETAEGLAAAHAQGLVHRDIKPANLWLEGTGDAAGAGFRRVKILDFGLARAVQDDHHLTAAGGVLGTPAYMAPEQAGGEEVDHRADLFSLGAVLYRCCTGEAPFSGPNTMAVLSALANKVPVAVSEKNPAVPPALADLIMHLLAKKPADRPQSAEEAAEALGRMEPEPGTITASRIVAPAPRRRRVSALTTWLAAALVLGLAATAVAIVVKVRTPDGKETQVTAPPGSKVNVDDKGNVTVALPADAPVTPGDAAVKADPPELEFRLKDGSSPVEGLLVAPDGKTVVSGSGDGKLRVWDLETRQVVRSYLASSGVTALALHPDGKSVAATCQDGSLFTWNIEKGEVIRQYTGYPVHAWGVTFAKKGDLIVTPDRDTQAVICWDAKTGEHRVLARFPDEKAALDSIAASPDGEQVAVTTQWGGLSPMRLLKLSSGEVVSTSTVRIPGGANPVFAEDGKEIFTAVLGGVLLSNRDALHPEAFFAGKSSSGGISLAPGGRFLAAAAGGSGTVDLWVRDRLIPFREWSGLARALRVAFTPDGKRLLSSHDDGTICVFRLPKDVPAWRRFPPLDPAWLARTIKLPPDEQVKEVAAELARRNPGFNDPLELGKDGEGHVWQVEVDTAKLEDLSPFRGFPALRQLGVRALKSHAGRVWDLSCLRGMNLTVLDLRINCVWDLSPLRDMPLTALMVDYNPIYDLSALRKMKLSFLEAIHTNVDDLSPLQGMPLESVYLDGTRVKDLSPLNKAPLKSIMIDAEWATDLASLQDSPLESIGLFGDYDPTHLKVLRSIPTLKTINGKPAADFWKAIDAGEKPKPGG